MSCDDLPTIPNPIPPTPPDSPTPPAMQTANVLDVNGNTIGTLEVLATITEDVLAQQLAMYTYVPPVPTLNQIVLSKVEDAQAFGQQLLQQIEADNVLAGLTTAQVTQMISDYAALITMLQTGSLVTALANAQSLSPSDGMTQTRLNAYIVQLQAYLGVS